MPECANEENIVRALRTANWDEARGRYSSDLFTGENTSVSRLCILGLPELFKIFHVELDRPEREPPNIVIGAGELNVGKAKEICAQYISPLSITVNIDPTESNPAHAIIPQKLSRKLALLLIHHMMERIHPDPIIR